MKQLMLTAAMAATFFTAHAQKGSWYLGGAGGFFSSTDKSETAGVETPGAKHTTWSFSPEIGTFLTNNLQAGAGIGIRGHKHDARQATTNTQKDFNWGATVYVRNFFGSGNFRPFLGINASFLPGTGENTQGTVTTKTKGMIVGANLNAGFAYSLSKRVTAVGSIATFGFTQYTYTNETTDTKDTRTEIGLDANTLGNRFNVGVYYTL